MTDRNIAFTKDEMRRLREVCRALGTSYREFVRFAVLQAISEVEGYGREERRQQWDGRR